mmetsp:Transcript_6410/g.5777  ORF Transcript_6410/g.5777 Transcript_6410/m.5777 type:complete len:104 (+) Transcript_6410:1442-1753(+)
MKSKELLDIGNQLSQLGLSELRIGLPPGDFSNEDLKTFAKSFQDKKLQKASFKISNPPKTFNDEGFDYIINSLLYIESLKQVNIHLATSGINKVLPLLQEKSQ